MTLNEARRRTGLDLISDECLPHSGLGTVRESQFRMETLYPRHKQIRLTAMRYFLDKGFEIYPRGITVNGVGVCPDFAIFRGAKIIFVECLTSGWVNSANVRRKENIKKYAPIIFVTEEKLKEEFKWNFQRDYYNFNQRLQRLANSRTFYLFVPSTGRIKRYRLK